MKKINCLILASLNSINDFVGNIISIQNAYEGSLAGDASVSDYIKSVNPDLDTQVKNQIQACIAAIQKIPEPFAKSASGAEADNAVTVVGTDLVDILEGGLHAQRSTQAGLQHPDRGRE